MPEVLICYEHINREVLEDTLLKLELERRGISCEVIPFNGPGFYYYSKRRNRAKVVICPWLRYNDNVYHYLCLADSNNNLVNLQWEQVYCQGHLTSGLCVTSGQSINANHICWGKNTQERLAAWGVDVDRLPITGAMQLDFGQALFEGFFPTREELSKKFGLDSSKRWCLYVSSFGYANYGEAGIQKYVKVFGQYILKIVKLHRESQAIMLDWIEELLKNFDCEFIYRPHPSENLSDRLENIKKKYNNFHIISSGEIRQWIRVADRINLWISTSNAEILSLNFNYEIIRPLPIPDDLEVESLRTENPITTVEGFLSYNMGNNNQINDITAKKKNLQHFYANFYNQQLACVKIADFIEEQIKKGCKFKYNFSNKEKIIFGKNEIKKKIVSLITEFQMTHPNLNIIDKLPVRDIIKQNMKRAINNYHEMQQMQKRLEEFIKIEQITK